MPTFDALVNAVHTAVLQATDIAEAHELDGIRREEYWYKDPVAVEENGQPIYRPKMMTMRLPFWEEGVLKEKDVQVPMQSLVTGQSLRIDNLTVEMEVEIQGLDEEKTDGNSCLMVSTNAGGGLLKKSNKAKVSVTFTGQDPPEGYARIDNQLIKLLP